MASYTPHHPKGPMRIASLAFLLFFLVGCDSGYTEGGNYHTIVFTEPGPTDETVDALAAGDWASLNLDYDDTFTVVVHRANRTDPEAEGTVTLTTGTYTQRGDRIFLDAEGSGPALLWTDELEIVNEDYPTRLETPRLDGHGAPFRLVFTKIGIL